jgi:hypothetical protein
VVASSRDAVGTTPPGEPLLDRLPAGPLAALETLLLGALAAALALYVFPQAFAIESQCVGPTGQQTTAGDTYVAASVVLGTLGWIGVFLGVLYGSIAERRGLVLLLPLVWFVVFVVAALVAAALVGPVPCPS